MTTPIDHIVLLVHDLAATTATCQAAGFGVSTRKDATQKGGASYRFVCFEDGSYLLLTAFTPEGAASHRLGPILAETEGPGDWSLTVPSVDEASVFGAGAGVTLGATHDVANDVKGGHWALRLLLTGIGAGGDDALPFLIEDVQGRNLRIPAPVPHANGATGIAELTIAAADPEGSARRVAALAGLPQPLGTRLTVAPGQTLRFVPLDPQGLGTARTGGCTGIRLSGVTAPLDGIEGSALRITAGVPA